MKLPHVPNRIERMWMEYMYIRKWNRLGGIEFYIDPDPRAMDQYPRLRREAERDIRHRYKEMIKKNRIGIREAARRIWKAGHPTKMDYGQKTSTILNAINKSKTTTF